MPSSEQVRLLTIDDIAFVKRLLSASEYIYQRFTFDELPMLLKHYPAVGMFRGNSLQSFLLAQTVNAPSASCFKIKTTVRRKDGSLRTGRATKNEPER